MKSYTFKLIIHEGSDEFWEDINKYDRTGCEEVRDLLIDMLNERGFYTDTNCELELKKFADE